MLPRLCSCQNKYGAYTLLLLHTTPPGAKRPHAWLVLFLENMLPLVVDLMQQKKLDFWNFYEFNLMKARFEII